MMSDGDEKSGMSKDAPPMRLAMRLRERSEPTASPGRSEEGIPSCCGGKTVVVDRYHFGRRRLTMTAPTATMSVLPAIQRFHRRRRRRRDSGTIDGRTIMAPRSFPEGNDTGPLGGNLR
jgi:hypothetical protein